MVQKIIWSPHAVQTYINSIEYLKKDWTQKEIDKFITATERKLDLLQSQPEIGIITHKRNNVRKTLILKRILLIYRYKRRKGEIELLMFFNTWQHPKKMRAN